MMLFRLNHTSLLFFSGAVFGHVPSQFHRSGRAKDARKHHGEAEETRKDRESGAKLEYRDQWGREITRKEAFRNLCYKVYCCCRRCRAVVVDVVFYCFRVNEIARGARFYLGVSSLSSLLLLLVLLVLLVLANLVRVN